MSIFKTIKARLQKKWCVVFTLLYKNRDVFLSNVTLYPNKKVAKKAFDKYNNADGTIKLMSKNEFDSTRWQILEDDYCESRYIDNPIFQHMTDETGIHDIY